MISARQFVARVRITIRVRELVVRLWEACSGRRLLQLSHRDIHTKRSA